jgi:rare lipoprotein A
MLQLTAAHRGLPLPTYVRVTNLENGRTTLVRVNDRGPFYSDRIIDLSFGAAYKLGFAHRGTARVRLEAWSPEGAPVAQARADRVLEEVPAPTRRFVLQAGAFRNLTSADALKAALERLTGSRAYVVRVSDEAIYRVRIGPIESEAEALRLRSLIMDANLDEPMIIRE